MASTKVLEYSNETHLPVLTSTKDHHPGHRTHLRRYPTIFRQQSYLFKLNTPLKPLTTKEKRNETSSQKHQNTNNNVAPTYIPPLTPRKSPYLT